jgi:hypothetical protein
MACFNITKYGFTSILDLITDVMKEMTGQGVNTIPYFRIAYPNVSLTVTGIGANGTGNLTVGAVSYKIPVGTKVTVTGSTTAGTLAAGNYYVYQSFPTSGATTMITLVTQPVLVAGGLTPGIVKPTTAVGTGAGLKFSIPFTQTVPPPHTPEGGAGGYVGPDPANPVVPTAPVDADDNTINVPWDPGTTPADGAAGSSFGVWILESTPAIDPLSDQIQVGSFRSAAGNSSNFRICFNALSDTKMAIHCATELQLPNTGNIAQLNNRSIAAARPTLTEPAGNLSSFGYDWTTALPTVGKEMQQIWLNRDPDRGSEGAYPMSYCITMTNRGWFFAVWEGSQEEVPEGTYDKDNNPNPSGSIGNSPLRWVLVQRPVDRITGHVRGGSTMRNQITGNPGVEFETSRCPVFVVSGMGAPQSYTKFILREVDVSSPSLKKSAVIQTEDNPALLNPYPQQSLTENGDFVVTFLNNLSTPRFRYADELDMLGTVSSEVVGAGSTIEVDVYNEFAGGYDNTGVKISGPTRGKRVYQALYGSERFGTGMRLMILTKMGWESAPVSDDTYNVTAEDSHI